MLTLAPLRLLLATRSRCFRYYASPCLLLFSICRTLIIIVTITLRCRYAAIHVVDAAVLLMAVVYITRALADYALAATNT